MADIFTDFSDDDVLVAKFNATKTGNCIIIKDKGRTTDGPMGGAEVIGENTLEVKFSEVKNLLAIDDPEWGGKGLVVDVWNDAEKLGLYLKK